MVYNADAQRRYRATPKGRASHRAHDDRYKQSELGRATRRAWYLEKQARVDEIKLRSGCVDCGYNAHPRALDFDHVGEKVAEVALLVRMNAPWPVIEAEIAKCEVRCANCHRIKTFNEGYASPGRVAVNELQERLF